MSDGMQMRRLGAAIDKLFAYRPRAKPITAPKAKPGKRKPLTTKKQSRHKRSPAT